MKEKANVSSKNEQQKLDAKKRKNNKSDVCAETAGDSDEPIILKQQNTIDISIRRSARVQQKKNKVKALVKEAKDKYTENHNITYHAPRDSMAHLKSKRKMFGPILFIWMIIMMMLVEVKRHPVAKW